MAVDPDTEPMLQRLASTLLSRGSSLSHKDLVWAYAFVLGVIWSWRSLDHGHGELVSGDLERNAHDVIEDIVSFCFAGLQAILARRRVEHNDAKQLLDRLTQHLDQVAPAVHRGNGAPRRFRRTVVQSLACGTPSAWCSMCGENRMETRMSQRFYWGYEPARSAGLTTVVVVGLLSGCTVPPRERFFAEAQVGTRSSSIVRPADVSVGSANACIVTCSLDRLMLGARLGYRWNRYVATTLGYVNFGSDSRGGLLQPSSEVRWDGWVTDTRVEYPLGSRFFASARLDTLYGRVRTTQTTVEPPAQTRRNWSGWALGYGGGLGWRVSKRFDTELGWEHFNAMGRAGGGTSDTKQDTGRINYTDILGLTFRFRF
jgi:hypothetical protein